MAYKSPFELYKLIRQEYKPRITKLEVQIADLKQKMELQELENEAVKDEIAKELSEGKNILAAEVESLKNQVQEKQSLLDRRELKKLATEYDSQEKSYKTDQDSWFKYVVLGFCLIVLSVLWSSMQTTSGNWSDKIDYYFINVALVTFLVFALRQYSAYKDLRIDYANRKTIAQSYFNILNSAEDKVIKQKYIEASVDVLVSRTKINNQAHTIPEQLIESITEIAKNLSRK
jgi:hypothetical protein